MLVFSGEPTYSTKNDNLKRDMLLVGCSLWSPLVHLINLDYD